jgi:hypothetical protein
VQDGAKSKLSVAGTAVLDVGLLAPIGGNNKQSVSVPLRCNMGGSELEATFWVSFPSAAVPCYVSLFMHLIMSILVLISLSTCNLCS